MLEDSRAGDGRAVHSWTGRNLRAFFMGGNESMKKENAEIGGTTRGVFEAEYDRVTHRTSYNSKFVEHYTTNLGVVSGFLGMFYQLVENDCLEDVSYASLSFIVLEMQDKLSDMLANI
jgi:hypothetical protein